MGPRYRLYRAESGAIADSQPQLPEGHEYELWRPRFGELYPGGLPGLAFAAWFAIWFLVHRATTWHGQFGYLLIRHAGQVVHYTGYSSRCYRFPFMRSLDLQLGPSWTSGLSRRMGLARFAVHSLMTTFALPGRSFWWVCREANAPSNRFAESVGFAYLGPGRLDGIRPFTRVRQERPSRQPHVVD